MPSTREDALVGQWRQMLSSYNAVACALDRALQDQHAIGLSEFEILDRLVESSDAKCRMLTLAADMYLSQSALSRAVSRLEREGLVTRDACTDDRRSIFVTPSDAGRQRHAAARDTHREVLATHLT